jgi:hypothetical protein
MHPPLLSVSQSLQAKRQDGEEYKRSSLLDMVSGILRHINAEYKLMEINGKAAPAPLNLNKDALLSTAADSTCRQLTAAGKGTVKQQPAFTPAEWRQLVQGVKKLPPSSLKHTARKYLFLGNSWGGREAEYPMIQRRWGSAFGQVCGLQGRLMQHTFVLCCLQTYCA